MGLLLSNLLNVSSDAIVHTAPDTKELRTYFQQWKHVGKELGHVLSIRNGFWAYESSLLVRPFSNGMSPLGLLQWNENNLWKDRYACKLEHVLFFSEDAFGCQYCLLDDRICLFDPETAQFEEIAHDFQDWINTIISDYEYRTGYPLAREWQVKNHPMEPGTRLLPNVPFVLGGKYSIDNLHIAKDIDGMMFRASISNQIRDVADGEQVILDVVKKDPTE